MTFTKIETCTKCGKHFEANMLKQAEVRHKLALFGEGAARDKMLELMEPIHENHLDNE